MRHRFAAALAAPAVLAAQALLAAPAQAQAPQGPRAAPQAGQIPQAQPGQPSQVTPAPSSAWEGLPRLQLEAQFAGPLRDTVIQRWRDPDGAVCYVYLPITAPHSPPTASGFVQYGSGTIGSISCMPASGGPKPPAPRR